MKLTFEQIKQITTGAIRIKQKEDGIHFYKCTEKQIDAWTEKHKDLGMRAASTTGVCLDFHTIIDRIYTSSNHTASACYFNKAETACADFIDIFKIAECGNVNIRISAGFKNGDTCRYGIVYTINFYIYHIHMYFSDLSIIS